MPANKALRVLKKDAIMKTIIESVSKPKDIQSLDVYPALCRTIIYQQISTKAADAIYERFCRLLDFELNDPTIMLNQEEEALKAAGLSTQKRNYIRNISSFFIKPENRKVIWDDLSDQEIKDKLIDIKGVGLWTVEMLLIFTLQRPDVFSIGDLALRTAVIENYKLDKTDKAIKKQILAITDRWSPYRSLASRYLWQWIREHHRR